MNLTNYKSICLGYVRELRNHLPLFIIIFILGVLSSMWFELWANETANTLSATSLFLSLIALFISNYFIVENAIELRANNKKKLLSNYCARFSNNQKISKVLEWLISIAEFDSNGNFIKLYPKDVISNNVMTNLPPTQFEKEVFYDFLVELNIQVKNKQLEKEDVEKFFSPYVLIFKEALQTEKSKTHYLRNINDLAELIF